MAVTYTPVTQLLLDLITGGAAPTWTGPALPRPDGAEGLEEMIDTLNKLTARAQYLIQAKDALSVPYTLNGITAPASRFLLGTEQQIEEAADLHGLIDAIEALLRKLFEADAYSARIASAATELKQRLGFPKPVGRSLSAAAGAGAAVAGVVDLVGHGAAPVAPTATATAAAASADYSAFTLEDPAQFSMAWTTFEDTYRKGFPRIPQYVKAVTDADAATRDFWLTLRSNALPYNLFVLQKLTDATATAFRNTFGAAWTADTDALLAAGRLYGIDMTIFAGFQPQHETNGTIRFTPSTMLLLEMDQKSLNPIAVYVADPENDQNSQVYLPGSPAWIYALLAAKTSMTVWGIWLGHVYTQHLVTAAMQMVTLNILPAGNIVYQLLAPQSQYTIPFDVTLLLTWPNLSPPTSIDSTAKFLTLCNKYAAGHDFFSTDPIPTLARMNLSATDFTSDGGQEWDLYPNVQKVLRLWQMTADYVGAVVDAGYPTDGSVAGDADLQRWITAAGTQGNLKGLPKLDTKAALKDVVTSVLFRITFHGIGRLRSISSPEPAFATNYPPCLQSNAIPKPDAPLNTAHLLKNYLPNTGTLGKLVSFYYIFAYNAPYVPVVPNAGPDAELFYDQSKYASANQALIQFRSRISDLIRELQPDWVQIGQWPRNIEL